MRLRDAVVKRSNGRVFLHHLRSSYFVEVNDAALAALQHALRAPETECPGRRLLERLRRKDMVEEGEAAVIAERNASALVSLEIEPVGRCNLSCRHCFVDFSNVKMRESVFYAVLRGAERLGAIELTFNGGEALLNGDCPEWIAAAVRQGLRAQVFTNATLVTARIARQLADAGLAKATVSLDGFRDQHDRLRGRGAFEGAIRGIRHLVGAGIPVHVTTMVHPENEGSLTELHRYCREHLMVSGVRVSTIAAMGRAAQRPELQLPPALFEAIYRDEPPREPATRPGVLPCEAGVNKLFVSARGEVHGCHLFDGVSPPLGDLNERPLHQIYASIDSSAPGALLRRFDAGRLRACVACPALAQCRGGCRARAWSMTGDPYGVDPVSCRKYVRLAPTDG